MTYPPDPNNPYRQPRFTPNQPPPQYQPPRPHRRKPHVARYVLLGIGTLIVVFIAVSAALSGGKNGSTPPAASSSAPSSGTSPAAAAAPKPAARTVTYTVTGSAADVTYGPAGSDYSGAVPMAKTAPLGSPSYYAITAQLQGGGAVACSIAVNGKVIDHAEAAGGYNIAQCEISQDPLSGDWTSTNG